MTLPARLKSRVPAVNPAVAVWRRYEYERSDVIASPHALSRNWVCSIKVYKSMTGPFYIGTICWDLIDYMKRLGLFSMRRQCCFKTR